MKNEAEVEVVGTIEKEENVKKTSEVWSVTSLILGLVGISFASIPCGILAIIFGLKGKKENSKGMATAGFILGIADIVLGIIYSFISLIFTIIYMMNL
ncbi:MAG: DUF4190 domain-containing protein [Clostridiales bacterium]|nr:DUF4190 domain-containing protein [Clostridiales bacterium]